MSAAISSGIFSSTTSGWLIKQGGSKGGFKTWKKRWFVLTRSELNYYSQPSRKDLKGTMIITDCVVEHASSAQVSHPHCISVRTVERELLLRCCSAEEAESWRQAIISCSSASLPASGHSVVADDVLSSSLASSTFSSSLSASHSKTTSDSLMAQDGDSLDTSGISIGHRIMTQVSRDSSKSFCSSSSGAIPGWDGKKNSIGFIRIPGTSTMFWDLEQSCAIFLPHLWIYPHINCVRFPDYLELGRHKQVQVALLRYSDTSILFTDLVYKFNRANKMQQRVLIITDQALYVLNEVKLTVCRRVPLQELGGVSYSTIGDDYMVIHVPSHYDYLLSCSRKKEATDQLQLAYRQKLGRSLCVRVYGDEQSLGSDLWMKSVWDPKGRYGKSEGDRIISGVNRMGISKTMSVLRKKKMFLFGKPALLDPLYSLQSDQLLALLLTPHHPLGKQFVEFIDQFRRRFDASSAFDAQSHRVTLGGDPRIMVQELSMTNAIAVIKSFFAQRMTAVNMLLQELKFQLSDGHLNDALQAAVFPSVAGSLMPLVHQQHAAADEIILKTAAVIKKTQLTALDYLKMGPKLLNLLMQGVSNNGIFAHASAESRDGAAVGFDVPAECMRLPFWPVYTMLQRLCEEPTPMKKLATLNTSIELISCCVSLYSANAIVLNGDDLLPALVYCISMSDLKHPLAEMNFVAEFAQMGQPTSQQMYCLNVFEIALALMQQLHRDLPAIEEHCLSSGDLASAVADSAADDVDDDDDEDTEEEEPFTASSSGDQ